MSTDDDLRRSMARGAAFREWCEGADGLYAVISAVRADYLRTIEESDPAEAQLREDAYHRIRALADIRRSMEVVITAGSGAREMINALTRKQEKKHVR